MHGMEHIIDGKRGMHCSKENRTFMAIIGYNIRDRLGRCSLYLNDWYIGTYTTEQSAWNAAYYRWKKYDAL